MKIGLVMPVSWEPLMEFLPSGSDLPVPLEFPFGSKLAAELRRRGHEVHIFTLCHHFPGERHIAGNGVFVHIAGYRKNFKLCVFDGQLIEARRIAKMIQEASPCDIYNAHWSYEFARGVIAARVLHVVTVRDQPWKVLWLFKPKTYRLMRLVLAYYVIACARNLSVASPYMAGYLYRWHRIQKPVRVIPNAVEGHRNEGHDTVRSVGAPIVFVDMANGFNGCKNIPNLLRAYALFRKWYTGPSELRLYGGGNSENEEAGAWIRRNGCGEGVVLRGRQPHREMLSEIAKEADIFIHASREESFGGVIAEAMSMGFPTIVGKSSGAAPWVAGAGKTGYLVDVNSPQDMARSMLKLAEDGVARKRFAHASLKRYKECFTLDAVTDQYEALYKEILNG